jgi:cell shape-determining protein MreD
MIRYLVYLVVLYLALPANAILDISLITVFFVIMQEDERFALAFAFVTGLLIDLYQPIRVGVNTLILITLTQLLLYLKKYLVLNPLTTLATFVVFYLIKTAITNIVIAAPIDPLHVVYTIAAFFPVIIVLSKVNFGTWMKVY